MLPCHTFELTRSAYATQEGNCWSMPRRFMCLGRFDALARSLDCDCVRV
jgi:hypothetical protein